MPLCVCVCSLLSRVQLYVTSWTVSHQAFLSMGFSRQEYWSGLPCPPPGDFPQPGIESGLPALQMDSLPSEPKGSLKINSIPCVKQNFKATPNISIC